jgi:uridine kinase
MKDLQMNEMQQLIFVLKSIKKEERLVLGIDGLSRAGKTTFVNKLSNKLLESGLSHHVFHIDDFIVQRDKRYGTGKDEWLEYYSLQWDVDYLKTNLFDKLHSSDSLVLPFYDSKTDQQIMTEVSLAGKSIIILEGVFLLRKEWIHTFDYTVFFDCPREVRFARESVQTQQNLMKFEQRYWRAEDYYLQTIKPFEKVDIIFHCQNAERAD